MPDPLDALRLDAVPIEPRADFAADLLRRIEGREEPMPPNTTRLPSVTPALHYWNADAALVWLTNVLGLTESWAHRSAEGGLQHAELRWGRGLVSINYKRSRYEQYGPTNVLLLAQDRGEVDAAYRRAVTAGADVVRSPQEDPTGYGFTVRDPEGNQWQIGTDALEALRSRQGSGE